MSDFNEQKKKCLEFLKLFNEILEKPSWHENVYLKAVHKKLLLIRDEFKNDADLSESDLTRFATDNDPSHSFVKVQRQGFQEVYIVLYNAQGTELSKWESLLNSIERQAVNRPSYAIEDYAKAMMRNTAHPFNEAYVAIDVPQEDILASSTRADRYGQALITLEDGAIKIENIQRFVHKSGIYQLQNKKLLWLRDAENL
jgi:intracellular multiplication protein IcmQ